MNAMDSLPEPADVPPTEPSEELAVDLQEDPAVQAPSTETGLSSGSAATPTTEPDAAEARTAEPVEIHPHRVVEAVLFAADSPMLAAKIAAVLGVGDARDVRKHIERLNAEYAERGSAFRIEELAGGFQMLTLPAYNTWLRKLLRARQETRLSPAALETLAIVAYKQPCTRAEVEAIRGVAAGDLINRLREINLLKIVGRAEDLGRPLLYGTTKRFLEVFGLPSLEELPEVEALSMGAGAAKPADETAAAAGDEVDAERASADEPVSDAAATEEEDFSESK